jgi:hypothetical protein
MCWNIENEWLSLISGAVGNLSFLKSVQTGSEILSSSCSIVIGTSFPEKMRLGLKLVTSVQLRSASK